MMNKIVHNKKQNSGLIFELLARQIILNTMNKNNAKAKKALALIQKYFKPGTRLNEEYRLINVLLQNQVERYQTASRMLGEVLNASKVIDQIKLKDEKYKLINEIKSEFPNFFDEYIPSYKVYGAAYSLIENARHTRTLFDVNQKIMLEEVVINHLLNNKLEKEELVESSDADFSNEMVESLALKIAINKFNQKYEEVLNEDQKDVLKHYIGDQRFDKYVEKMVNKISNSLYEHMKTLKDKEMLQRVYESMMKINDVNKIEDKDKKTEVLMNYLHLTEELTKLRDQK